MSTMAVRPLGRAAWIVPAICAVLVTGGLLAERHTHTGMFRQTETVGLVPLALGFALVEPSLCRAGPAIGSAACTW